VDAANSALLIYLACVRKLLRRFNGYECQEADGSFMLAFKTPTDAILFCLMVPPFSPFCVLVQNPVFSIPDVPPHGTFLPSSWMACPAFGVISS
jgi:hypothetical protein